MDKCNYCNKKSETLFPVIVEVNKKKKTFYCDTNECKEKTISFFRYAYGKGKIPVFLAVISASMLLIMFGPVFNNWLFAVGWALMGLDIFIFPFGTPQTFAWLGIKKTVVVIRIMGLFIIATAPLLRVGR